MNAPSTQSKFCAAFQSEPAPMHQLHSAAVRRAPTGHGRSIATVMRVVCAAGFSMIGNTGIAQSTGPVPATVAVAGTPSQSALRLYVVNGDDRPVPTAEVRVSLGNNVATGRTDSAGVFRIDGLVSGDWRASVRRIGFKQVSFDFHLHAGDNRYTVAVDEVPEELSDVRVVSARTRSLRLRDFEERVSRAEPNSVVTRADIVKRNPVKLSQLLRGMAGIHVVEQNDVRVAVASRGAVPKFGTLTACPLRMAVDGHLRPAFTDIDEVAPADVHGVEVYYGPGRLPSQLANLRTSNWCGLIAIWTRDR